jgi:hypothetical protein
MACIEIGARGRYAFTDSGAGLLWGLGLMLWLLYLLQIEKGD